MYLSIGAVRYGHSGKQAHFPLINLPSFLFICLYIYNLSIYLPTLGSVCDGHSGQQAQVSHHPFSTQGTTIFIFHFSFKNQIPDYMK